MSRKLEKVLEFLINEEVDKAQELLHTIFVEEARKIHENIVAEEDREFELDDFEDDLEDTDGLATDANEIDAEETFEAEDFDSDDEFDSEEDFDIEDAEADIEGIEDEDEVEGEVEERVDDLEVALEELRAEFDELMGDSEEEMDLDGEEMDLDGEEMDVDGEEMDVSDEMDFEFGETLDETAKLKGQSTPSVEDTTSKSPIAKPSLDKKAVPFGSDKKSGTKKVSVSKKFGTENQAAKLSPAQKAKNEKTPAKSMGFGKGVK